MRLEIHAKTCKGKQEAAPENVPPVTSTTSEFLDWLKTPVARCAKPAKTLRQVQVLLELGFSDPDILDAGDNSFNRIHETLKETLEQGKYSATTLVQRKR